MKNGTSFWNTFKSNNHPVCSVLRDTGKRSFFGSVPETNPNDPIQLINTLQEKGIHFRSLTESIDTSTPGGKFMIPVFAGLAQLERDIIRERTMAGLIAKDNPEKKLKIFEKKFDSAPPQYSLKRQNPLPERAL